MVKIKKLAFTLAEVLITLGIIGVVAAMTIPGLITKYRDAVTVTKVKKTYSEMSQAYKLWADENECYGDYSCFQNQTYLNRFTHYLKAVDVVYKGQNKSNKLWLSDSPPKYMDGSAGSIWIGVSKANPNSNVFLLSNGVTLSMELDYTHKQCVLFWMDINGKDKPNRVGLDVFPIGLGAYNNDKYPEIHPYYNEDNEYDGRHLNKGLCTVSQGGVCNPDDGHSPTAYILKHNKVFDIQKLGYRV